MEGIQLPAMADYGCIVQVLGPVQALVSLPGSLNGNPSENCTADM